MNLSDFLSPISNEKFSNENYLVHQLGFSVEKYLEKLPDLSDYQLAIIGVLDDRNAIGNAGCSAAADYFRKEFYKLYPGNYNTKIVDLGNIKAGNKSTDTYIAVQNVVEELLERNIVPIIIGGGQDITLGQFLGYKHKGKNVDLVVIDSQIDFEIVEDIQETDSKNYMNEIILMDPNYLFNFSNIGYQGYFTNPEISRMMDKLFFDAHRLGEVRGNVQEFEPVVRMADLISIDFGVIRSSDARANGNAGPNGLFAEEICQLARYAGMNDKLSSIGFYEFNPKLDQNDQSAMLLAQMVWCFVDGFYNRKNDFPEKKGKDFIKYRTTFKEGENDIVFLKSKKSDKWWMEIPASLIPNSNKKKLLIPCSHLDYQSASKGEIPERWWKTIQKLDI